MVYLYSNPKGQTITIPNASATQASGTLSFVLIGEASGLPVYEADAAVAPVWGGLYYKVTLGNTTDAPAGEMRYELRNGKTIVANGVARVLTWHEEPKEDGTAQTIIQYE